MPYDGKYAAYLPGDVRGQFLTSLGFRIPNSITSKGTGEASTLKYQPKMSTYSIAT